MMAFPRSPQPDSNPKKLRGHARRKRNVAVLGSVLAVGLLAGCASSGGSSSSGGSNTLTIWTYAAQDLNPYYATFEAAFTKSHPGVTIKTLVVGYNDMENKLLAAAATKTGPDVIVYDPAWQPQLAAQGALADISTEWKGAEASSKIPSEYVKEDSGKVYSAQGYVNTTALYYNKDVLAAAGVNQPPTTFAQLKDDLSKVVSAGKRGWALCGAPTGECETQAAAWILGSGGNYNNFSNPRIVNALDEFSQLSKAGAFVPDGVTWGQNDAWAAFAKGDIAFTQNGNWNLTAAAKLPFKWGVVALPGAAVAPGGEGEAVGGFTKNKQLAFDYINSGWWDAKGQIEIFNSVGSVPTRTDVQSDPSLASNTTVQAFFTELRSTGTRSPLTDPGNYGAMTAAVGTQWSAILAGQSSAVDATAKLTDQFKGYFAK